MNSNPVLRPRSRCKHSKHPDISGAPSGASFFTFWGLEFSKNRCYGEELTSAATEKPSEAATATPEKKTTTKKNRSEKKAAPEKPAEAVVFEATAPAAPTPEKNTILEKAAETVAAAPKAEKKPVPKKKAAPKKSTAAKKSEENVPAPPKAEKKTPAAPTVILQSPFGGEITVDAVKTLVGEVDKVYVRIDQNKLYWVKGEETGNKDIW